MAYKACAVLRLSDAKGSGAEGRAPAVKTKRQYSPDPMIGPQSSPYTAHHLERKEL